jgi:hypothetical protein
MKIKELDKISVSRLTLKSWAALDDYRKQIADCKDPDSACALLLKSIELAITERPKWDDIFWMDASDLYVRVSNANQPSIQFPIFTPSKKESDPLPWEYPGRTWLFWLNVFAKNYGWSEESIAALDIDTAIGLYQEIVVDEQMRQEWQWGLSEKSVEYVPSTKKSKFVPLSRPEWMQAVAKPKKIIKTMIRKDMLPAGNIINLDLDQ